MRLLEAQCRIQQRLNTAMIGGVQEVLVESHDRRGSAICTADAHSANRIVQFCRRHRLHRRISSRWRFKEPPRTR